MITAAPPVRSTPYPSWPQFDRAELQALSDVLESGVWGDANGPQVTALQEEYASYIQADHALAVTNGTVAIVLALRALGIGAGDEVIVPPYTFLSTASAVLEVNALPIFVDIEPDSWCIDPDAVEAAITERTRAIIPVHLGGHPADMDRLLAIAKRHNLAVIEDAAHAHGSRWNDRPVGAIGTCGTWSFQASKNLTGGEGGMVTTNDPHIAEMVTSLRNCGRKHDGAWYAHHVLGGNFRLTEWQSAILRVQLQRYPEQLARRDQNGKRLDAMLSTIEGINPLRRDPRATVHAYHLYQFSLDPKTFGIADRETFLDALRQQGIPASAGYPIPLYAQPLFRDLAFDTRATGYDPSYEPTRFSTMHLPVVKSACSTGVWLPHWVLLDDPSGMEDIAEAIATVQRLTRA